MSYRRLLFAPDNIDVQTFQYPILPGGKAGESTEPTQASWIDNFSGSSDAAEDKEQQIRRRALEEGRAAARADFDAQVAALRDEVSRALREFSAEKNAYFHRAEEQIVRLALAIVRKILHRESQVDPLLLAGILRVALEKLDNHSSTRLRVNPRETDKWRQYFARVHEPFPAPQLIEDPALEADRCILETEMGSTEIGVETQLQEIEQGFLDLLAQRPASL